MTLLRPVTLLVPGARAAGLLLALVLLAPSHAPSIAAQESPLLQAMRDELTRAMTGLRITGQPAPYYIAYSIDDIAGRNVQATLGALVGDGRRRSRTVRVDVRVGDYARDSSRFVSFDRDPGVTSMYAMGVVEAPLDDDVAVLRRQLWLVTDAAYRKALATFAKKQAALQNQASPDPVPDWSRETPKTTRLPVVAPETSADAWIEHVRTLSAALARPELTRSDASVTLTQGTRYSVNSEGFTTVSPIQSAQLRLSAETQAEDGMPLRDSVTAHARTVAGPRQPISPSGPASWRPGSSPCARRRWERPTRGRCWSRGRRPPSCSRRRWCRCSSRSARRRWRTRRCSARWGTRRRRRS
jgi:hypothetical protein